MGGKTEGPREWEGKSQGGSNPRKLLPVLGGKFVPLRRDHWKLGDLDSLADPKDPGKLLLVVQHCEGVSLVLQERPAFGRKKKSQIPTPNL